VTSSSARTAALLAGRVHGVPDTESASVSLVLSEETLFT